METWFRVSLEQEMEKNPNLEEEMLKEMRKYLEQQPHLPQNISDVELVHHIQSCDFDVDTAKTALEVNYTLRSKTEFFQRRDPNSTESVQASQCLRQWIINNADTAGQIALMAKLDDVDPANYNFNNASRHSTMLLDLMRLEYGTIPGFVGVVDMSGFTFYHLIKAPIGPLRHFLRYLQEGSPSKISALHMINTKGSIIDKVMMLIKPLLSERISKMLFLHPGYETLYDHGFIAERMPIEYGGTAGYIKEISDESFNQIIKYTEYFKLEELQRIDESKKPRRQKYLGFI